MKILVGIPTYNMNVHAGVLISLFKMDTNTKHDLEIVCNAVPSIPFARNEIVNIAIDRKCDFVLFVDSDLQATRNNFLDDWVKLSKKKHAIVCASYLLKTQNRQFNLMRGSQEEFEYVNDFGEDIFEVDGGGTGLMLIPMGAFKQVGVPYFQMIVRANDFWPEDWDFCLRAKEKGYKVLVDPSVGTTHWGTGNWNYNPET